MRKILSLLLFISFSNVVFAQIGIFGGLGQSNFDLADNNEQSIYVPMGFTLNYIDGILHLGAELNYSVSPFSFEQNFSGQNSEISQLLIGGFIKLRGFTDTKVTFFFRGGGGYYMGQIKNSSSSGESITRDLKGAFGINFGGGMEFKMVMGILYLEFVYHLVNQKIDMEGAEAIRMDNFAGHLGFIFSL